MARAIEIALALLVNGVALYADGLLAFCQG